VDADPAESRGDRSRGRREDGLAAADRQCHRDGRTAAARTFSALLALERSGSPDAVEEHLSLDRAPNCETLKSIHDIERLVARASRHCRARDLVALRQSIAAVPRVRLLLDELQAPLVRSLVSEPTTWRTSATSWAKR
jgi:hypothetical protein